MILHLINLTSEATWRAPVDELIRVGPFQVSVRLPSTVRARSAQLLVAGGTRALRVSNGMATFTIDSILDHEVAVIE
jgi:hypothetical protein